MNLIYRINGKWRKATLNAFTSCIIEVSTFIFHFRSMPIFKLKDNNKFVVNPEIKTNLTVKLNTVPHLGSN